MESNSAEVMTMLDKPLPKDLKAERAVLSCIFRDNDLLNDVISTLKANDFYAEPHRILYTKMIEFYKQSKPVEIVTFCASLGQETLNELGGMRYIAELAGEEATTVYLKNYVDIVKDLSEKRDTIKACINAVNQLYDKEKSAREIIDALETSFMALTEKETDRHTINLAEMMEKTLIKINDNYNQGGAIPGISSKLIGIDDYTNGFIKGDYILIGARPSMGKTAFVLTLINNMPPDAKVMLFEMDTTTEKIGVRLLAQNALINAKALSRGDITSDQLDLVFNKASTLIAKDNLYFNDRSSMSIAQIRAEAKKTKLKHGLDVVFIDHISQIMPDNLRESRNAQLSQVSKDLKSLAKELDVCLVVLSQLNRDCEKRFDKRPMLADLRDSGSLEQDADIVMFLYRDDYYAEREDRESNNPGVMEVIVAKNRDGEVGITNLTFNGEYQLITEPALIPGQPVPGMRGATYAGRLRESEV